MQVNSVSLANANSKPAFKGPREDLEKFAYMDEISTRKLALAKASNDVKDKKHKIISNSLYLAAPISGGLATACALPSTILTKVGKVNVSRASRVLFGSLSTLKYAGLFLGIDALFAAKRGLENKSVAVNEFSQKHPVMSFMGTVAASFAAFYGLKHGAKFLSNKLGSGKNPVKLVKTFLKASEKLNNSKTLDKASKMLDKAPAFAKNLTIGALSWGPLVFLLGRFSHDINHSRDKAVAFQDNYNQIKGEQAVIRAALNVQDEIAAAADEI